MTSPFLKPAAGLAGLAKIALIAAPAQAAGLEVQIILPQIEANPYYRPYLAAWIEDGTSKDIKATVAVWYDTRLRDNLGRGFLRDLRTWWRAEGEQMTLPADGISGPTRAPGTHSLTIPGNSAALTDLPPGDYVLAVEVSRENGGRELLRTPFHWGGAANSASSAGDKEIAAITVTVQP